ncbi:NAD-dependent epimerase/dehydratase family protein [Burkholderia cenocepacia]|uniref:NAD-dependent epimerase/dehydratase family protein n=1 Tax=Burkholderia cenocepacia TaxID=95486 RepID=UPI002AB66F24|nr:NAD-dependent epimerase/dehydratase family protein [Burkholderia cenocepacia]
MNIDTNSETPANHRKIVLAGATGLVGHEILRFLLADHSVDEVHVLARRAPSLKDPKLVVHIVDFRHLPPLMKVDEVYLVLGTTIRAAGSQQAFRAVDFDANLAVAEASVRAGARRIALVSAVSANAQSRIFYNRVKGELEDALKQLPLDALVIAQPSLLRGDRSALNQPTRIGERLATGLSRFIEPMLPLDYRPVDADAVGRALLMTLPTAQGTVVLLPSELTRIGRAMSQSE